MPLRAGSRLVVNASEAAVKAGLTHPDDLSILLNRGVEVYNVSNLHAKLIVLGRRAFIGSANASNHSANVLLEAVVMTSDRPAVMASRQYIESLCLHKLGPERLAKLQKLFRRPRGPVPGVRRRKSADAHIRPELPKLRIAQLEPKNPPSSAEGAQKAGERVARTKMKQRRTHSLEDFWWTGHCPCRAGDTVVQVLDEGKGREFVSPSATVIYTKLWKCAGENATFVYLEMPDRRRVALNRLAKRLGYGAKKQLRRNGLVRDRAFAEKLLSAWN